MEYKDIFTQTAEWQHERCGKFTASEIWKIMGKGRGKDEYFSETAKTYIKSRLAEIITQEPATMLEGLNAIEHGNAYELEAALRFEKETGLSIEYFGKANPKFIPYEPLPDFAGSSPDMFVMDYAGAEIKCPFNTTHHVTHLLIETPEDLKVEKPEYYGQCQFNMMCSKREKWFFISYDPRVLQYRQQIHILEIPKDKEYCEQLEERIMEAVKMLKVYLDCINPSVVVAERDNDVGATIVT